MMEFIPTSICFSFRTNSRFRIQLHVNFMKSKHLSSIQSFKSQQHITYFAANPCCIVLSHDSSCRSEWKTSNTTLHIQLQLEALYFLLKTMFTRGRTCDSCCNRPERMQHVESLPESLVKYSKYNC
jgi:hypothetical protein